MTGVGTPHWKGSVSDEKKQRGERARRENSVVCQLGRHDRAPYMAVYCASPGFARGDVL